MSNNKPRMQLILVVALILVLLPIGLAAACSRSFLYYPTRLTDGELGILSSRPGWRQDSFRVEPEVQLVGLVRPPLDASGTWLLFFGGNAMGLPSAQAVLELLDQEGSRGLAAWAYRGYDGSDGCPTETTLLHDARAQVAHLEKGYGVEPAQLVLVGQSLGSGVAAYLAATLNSEGSPAAGLVLLSPYTSIAAVFDDTVPLIPVGWAVADSYRTDRLVDRMSGPVLIVHGRDDTLIRVEHGRTLYRALGEQRAEMLELAGRGHNDLWEDMRTVETIWAFIDRAR